MVTASLYIERVEVAVMDAKAGPQFSDHRYTFVVDYSQNMGLPDHNQEQPKLTYYSYSLLSVSNLGVVDYV